jgi:hypothetical protein
VVGRRAATYGLVVLGSTAFVPITLPEYLAIDEALRGLLECLFLEEKFDFVAENYLELETAWLESAARTMVFRGQDYRWFQVELARFNRRVANLLSAAKTYVDHSSRHVDRIFGAGSDDALSVREAFSRQYDERLGYRVMEALRNFVQHRDLPVHAMSFETRLVERGDREQLVLYTVSAYLRPDDLQADGKFKKAVLEELLPMGDKVDLKGLVRDYIEGLAAVHAEVRDRAAAKIQSWEAVQDGAISAFKSAYPEDGIVGLAAVTRDAEGLYVEQRELFTDLGCPPIMVPPPMLVSP